VGEFGENRYEMIGSTVAMFAQCPEINGWSFWTWKKAPNTYPGLVTINMPKEWTTVMNWLGSLFGGKPQPPVATIREGMQEFIQAIKLENCNYDERMAQELQVE